MNLPAWTPTWSRRYLLSLDLLLQRRLWVFALLDGLVILKGLGDSLIEGDEPRLIYSGLVTFPLVLLALPAMSDVISLERRAGSLDLALTTSRSERYFVRRILTICFLAAFQGTFFMVLSAMVQDRAFPLPLVLINVWLVSALGGAVVLFWAVRLKGFAGVWIASVATFVLLGRWTFRNPVPNPYEVKTTFWFPEWEEAVRWGWNAVLLAVGIMLLLAYARRRLRRPETMLR